MNPFKSKILFIIFIISFFSNVAAENINLENLKSDDTYVYNYFDEFLDGYESTINKMIQNDITHIKDSEATLNHTVQLDSELQIYEEYGMNSSAKYVITPFYSFSKNLNELSELYLELDNTLELNTPNSNYFAKLTGLKILDKINIMQNDLTDISNISVLKKDDEILKFNTSNVKQSLEDLKLKTTYNVEKIGNITPTSNLTIFISTENPLIYEDVSIYGTGLNGNGKIVITGPENSTENIIITSNYYSKSYSFEKAGIYELKLTQDDKESESIEINVLKIPTEIIIENNFEFPILKESTISGKVVDTYGNFVNSKTITFGNETLNMKNGIFEKTVYSNNAKIENYQIKFYETEEYLSSKKVVSLNFLKSLLDIKIYAEKGKINLDEPCIITGIYNENEDNLKLNLWVNGEIIETFDSKNHFEKEILFNESGVYEIFATYDGDEVYKVSKSNVLTINVGNNENPISRIFQKIEFDWKILIIAIILIIFGSKIPNLIRKDKYDDDIGKIPEYIDQKYDDINHFEKTKIIEKTVVVEYSKLYFKLIKKYNIKQALTPKELLEFIKEGDFGIYSDLKEVVWVHEKTVYAGEILDNKTINNFYNLIETILEKL